MIVAELSHDPLSPRVLISVEMRFPEGEEGEEGERKGKGREKEGRGVKEGELSEIPSK